MEANFQVLTIVKNAEESNSKDSFILKFGYSSMSKNVYDQVCPYICRLRCND